MCVLDKDRKYTILLTPSCLFLTRLYPNYLVSATFVPNIHSTRSPTFSTHTHTHTHTSSPRITLNRISIFITFPLFPHLIIKIDRKITVSHTFSIQLDLLHFIGNAIIRYDDQVEFFAGAGGIEPLLNTLTVI